MYDFLVPLIHNNIFSFFFHLFTISSLFPYLVNFYTYFNHLTPQQYPTIPIFYLILITSPYNN
ncbi:hypothetical protein KSS87_001662, partial [Heliosperma pusillum]